MKSDILFILLIGEKKKIKVKYDPNQCAFAQWLDN